MSKRHRGQKQQQADNAMYTLAPFLQENVPYLKSESMQERNALKSGAAEHDSIQSLAYQIHCEKGGGALDNWLEAERMLRNNYHSQ